MSATQGIEPGAESAALEELRPGVYAWVQPDGSWWLNNAGAVAGGDGLLVIDTCATAGRTRRFLDGAGLRRRGDAGPDGGQHPPAR